MRIVRNGIIWIVLIGGLGFGAKVLWRRMQPSSSNANTIAPETSIPTSQPTTRPSTAPTAPGSITIKPVAPLPVAAAAAPTALTPAALTPAQLFERVSPSVVQVRIYNVRGEASKLGSGFVASNSGLIVTNYHVVKGAKAIKVFSDETNQLEVEGLAGIDPDGDLALIRVKGKFPPPLPLAPAVLPVVGSRAYAIGNPEGLTNTFSEGLVSGIRKINPDLKFVQTTAAITHGSSGGALVNEAGQVIGVTTLGMQSGNLNFAVDRDRIQKLLDSFKGDITSITKQQWVLTMDERGNAATWLAKAVAEVPGVKVQRSRIIAWIAEAYVRTGDRDGLKSLLDAAQLLVGNRDSGWYEEAGAAGFRARLGDAEKVSTELDTNANPRIRIYGHCFIAAALLDRGDMAGFAKELERASTLCRKQADSIIRADGLIVVVHAFADAGKFDEAMREADALEDTDDPNLGARGSPPGFKRNARSVALAFVANARAKRGDFSEALAIASKIFDVANACFVLTTVVQLKADADEPETAMKIAQRITFPYMRNHALLLAAEAFARQNDRLKARDCIAEARRAAKEIKEVWQIVVANSELVGTLAACGEFDSAERFAGELPDARQRSEAFGRIALGYAKRGDYQQMSDTLATKVTDPLAAIPSLNQIAVLQAKAGHVVAALETSARIPIPFARLEATRAILKAGAAKLPPQDMANLVRSFTTPDQRAVGFLGLAEGLMDRDAATTAKVRTDE